MTRGGTIALLVFAACHHQAAKPAAISARTPAASPAASAPAPARHDVCDDPESDLMMPDGDVATIDPAGVIRAIDVHRSELRRCYERYLKRDMRAGKITAVLEVRHDGTVSQVQMRGFEVSLDRCLCNVVAKLQFPPPHATAIVAYPMKFTGSL